MVARAVRPCVAVAACCWPICEPMPERVPPHILDTWTSSLCSGTAFFGRLHLHARQLQEQQPQRAPPLRPSLPLCSLMAAQHIRRLPFPFRWVFGSLPPHQPPQPHRFFLLLLLLQVPPRPPRPPPHHRARSLRQQITAPTRRCHSSPQRVCTSKQRAHTLLTVAVRPRPSRARARRTKASTTTSVAKPNWPCWLNCTRCWIRCRFCAIA
mmetsp:Transcript_14766/g.44311  ORF Transcript_14766/g.44311 Transcript_14766/m.44311 type:complete len:210 (-) Transcript_14766:6092-6721(-)